MNNLKELLTVVIPHHGGEEMLFDCLDSIERESVVLPRVVLIDNDSQDSSVKSAQVKFTWLEVITSPVNLGYAGGCNLGIKATTTPYVMLLNNDVIVTRDCFLQLVEFIQSDEQIAAVQPKILSFQNPEQFDYAGGAGGLIDFDGIPFAYGRIMNVIEKDQKQYDDCKTIFWASGTAVLFRVKALYEVGDLCEAFFAHQEEIDLCWRIQSRGWNVKSLPKVVIYHRGGATLNRSSNFKLYLNHRNNLWMWIRNVDNLSSVRVFRRITLELLAFLAYILRGELGRSFHQLKAWKDFLKRLPVTFQERRMIQAHRTLPDSAIKGIYQQSVIWQYYVRRRRFTFLLLITNEENTDHA